VKPICVKCQRFYRCKKTGLYFIEGMPDSNDTPPGTRFDSEWKPYKLWSGDLWQCQGCGHEVISGVGRNPVLEHYEPGFAELLERVEQAQGAPTFKVNDC
jgi:rubredoxin